VSDIDYNVTTKHPETPLFEGIYYNPYYNFCESFLGNKKNRVEKGSVSLNVDCLLRIISKVSFFSLPYSHLRLTGSSRFHLPDSFRRMCKCGFQNSICAILMSPLLYQECYKLSRL